jgi:putative transposase
MPFKKHTPEEIIGKLREAEIVLAQGGTTADACRRLAISEQTYYRWRKEYGGLKMDQARRMKDLQKENARLRRAISDLTLDKLILQEAPGETIEPHAASCAVSIISATNCLPRNAAFVVFWASTDRRSARFRAGQMMSSR